MVLGLQEDVALDGSGALRVFRTTGEVLAVAHAPASVLRGNRRTARRANPFRQNADRLTGTDDQDDQQTGDHAPDRDRQDGGALALALEKSDLDLAPVQ